MARCRARSGAAKRSRRRERRRRGGPGPRAVRHVCVPLRRARGDVRADARPAVDGLQVGALTIRAAGSYHALGTWITEALSDTRLLDVKRARLQAVPDSLTRTLRAQGTRRPHPRRRRPRRQTPPRRRLGRAGLRAPLQLAGAAPSTPWSSWWCSGTRSRLRPAPEGGRREARPAGRHGTAARRGPARLSAGALELPARRPQPNPRRRRRCSTPASSPRRWW